MIEIDYNILRNFLCIGEIRHIHAHKLGVKLEIIVNEVFQNLDI